MANLRIAELTDLSFLLDLIKEFCEIDNHQYDEERIRFALTPLLRDSSLGVVVALEVGSTIEGYAVLTWGWSLESGGREGLLDEIYIRNRNQGLGQELLAEVVRIADNNDVKIIFLETELANTRVRDFYLRNGFRQEDSIWLSLELNDPK